MTIRIHAPGQGRSTDYAAVDLLEQTTPIAYRKAQDVLVAAKKYTEGPGFLISRKRLIKRLQSEVYELKAALRADGYKPDLNSTPIQQIFSYLSEFSDVHPNWQSEYSALNRFIPLCF